jgi:hypothetical protein
MEDFQDTELIEQGLFAAFGFMAVIYLLIFLVILVSLWKIFEKAGKPGWAAIIPIYNIIVWLEILGKPIWWIVLLFIPFVNLLVALYLQHLTAKAFGKDIVMTLLLIFVPFIGYPMLAFGDAKYAGPPKD